MMIPFDMELNSPQEKYEHSVRMSLKKAKHLSERMKCFISDLQKSKIKSKDKEEIKKQLLNFINKDEK